MIDHLLWSTVAAAMAVAAVFMLRRQSAALRYAILMVAVIRFALPTHWLAAVGHLLARRLPSLPPAPQLADFPLSLLRGPGFDPILAPAHASHSVGNAAWALWALGCALSLLLWARRLWQKIDVVRLPEPAEVAAFLEARRALGMEARVELCITRPDHVPAARGWWRHCVVLPDGLFTELSAPELRAVLAHELAHVRRRDNLSAALVHGIVSAFWFHPLLWWMERRLLAERERACDELVLAHGARADDYLAAILKVCRMSFAGAAGYAGATGSNLKDRMEQIMSANIGRVSSRFLCAALGALVSIAVLIPLAGGFLRARPVPQAAEVFDIRRIMTQVEELMSRGKTDEAIALLQSEVDKNPTRMDLHIALGNVAVRAGRYDLAIAEFERVLANTTSDSKVAADGYLRLGETFRRKGDLNAAIAALEKANAADPNNAMVVQTLALTLDSAGRKVEAKQAYEDALKLDPRNGVVMNNLAYLLSETGGDLDAALVFAQRARQLLPKLDETADTIGWIFLKKGLTDNAIETFKEIAEKRPEHSTYRYHLGLAYAQKGERAAAIQEFEAALRSLPPDAEAQKIREALDGLR